MFWQFNIFHIMIGVSILNAYNCLIIYMDRYIQMLMVNIDILVILIKYPIVILIILTMHV
jgi:hypothetical protein